MLGVTAGRTKWIMPFVVRNSGGLVECVPTKFPVFASFSTSNAVSTLKPIPLAEGANSMPPGQQAFEPAPISLLEKLINFQKGKPTMLFQNIFCVRACWKNEAEMFRYLMLLDRKIPLQIKEIQLCRRRDWFYPVCRPNAYLPLASTHFLFHQCTF